MRYFGWMNRLRKLRGTLLDPFRNSDEAKLARRLLSEYEADIDFALAHAGQGTPGDIAQLLDLPEHIRGYGHVRERHADEVAKTRAKLRAAIQNAEAEAA